MAASKDNLIKAAIAEIKSPTFATTRQYLDALKVEIEGGLPKVARVDLSTNSVYFSIVKEDFFFVVCLSKEGNEIAGTEVETP